MIFHEKPLFFQIMLFQTKVGDLGVMALVSRCANLRVCGVSPDQVSAATSLVLKERCSHRMLV